MAVSHLPCIKTHFLEGENSGSTENDKASTSDDIELLPRGGTCSECRSYILWGDVIRGCHRRRYVGKAAVEEDDDSENEGDKTDDSASGDDKDGDSGDDAPQIEVPLKQTRRARSKVIPITSIKRGRKPKKVASALPSSRQSDSDAEFFDLDAIHSQDSDLEQQKIGRAHV